MFGAFSCCISRCFQVFPGTCVQVDGLEADDGGLVVLLVLAVRRQSRISWVRENSRHDEEHEAEVLSSLTDSQFLTDRELLSSEVEHEAPLLFVVR